MAQQPPAQRCTSGLANTNRPLRDAQQPTAGDRQLVATQERYALCNLAIGSRLASPTGRARAATYALEGEPTMVRL